MRRSVVPWEDEEGAVGGGVVGISWLLATGEGGRPSQPTSSTTFDGRRFVVSLNESESICGDQQLEDPGVCLHLPPHPTARDAVGGPAELRRLATGDNFMTLRLSMTDID